ncbi:ELMOD [Acanthosepion pharaonis]|uniref:ELMOD n=1 Tax=Acanthosepion pharaonis TaxID=158019 RepID=A0A812ECB2_ACAPH|nr:ELMOD [Sepia pharaonis]
MHRVTGKCELQRILDKAQPGARTSNHIEHCLRRSRNAKIRALVNEDVDIANSVVMLLHAKSIPNEMCAEITLRLGQIIGYTRIVSKVEMVRQRKHNVDISEYEHHLRQIWNILQPNMTLTGMKSKQWAEIGSLSFFLSKPITLSFFLPNPITLSFYHSLFLSFSLTRSLSLSVFLPNPITLSFFLPNPITLSFFLPNPITLSFFLSNPITLSFCLSP